MGKFDLQCMKDKYSACQMLVTHVESSRAIIPICDANTSMVASK
jgi:hypothetical protein